MNKKNNKNVSLVDAPQSIQLAVDLIELLEENKIEVEVAIDALQIVINDFKKKQQLNR
jgi:hypothetical protein